MKALVEHCRAFLVDWDGTLVDSLPIKRSNAAKLFADRLEADPAKITDSYSRHSGIPRRELFDSIASDCIGRPLDDREFAELSAEFTAMNQERVAKEGALRAGSVSVLARLRKAGRLVFISTAAAQHEIDLLAAGFGIAAECTEIMGSRPGFSKGPSHAAHVTEVYQIPSSEMAGIGDDEHDMRLFREAGILAVGITGTRSRLDLRAAGADLVVDYLDEVADHVE